MRRSPSRGAMFLAIVLAPATMLAMSVPAAPVTPVAQAHQAQKAQQPKAVEGLLLWNHLGSNRQLVRSEAGARVMRVHDIRHPAGVRGGAATSIGNNSNLRVSRADFFGADRTQGAVEIYLQKRMPVSVPFKTPLPAVFGVWPYRGEWGPIDAYWSDGFTGKGGLQFEIVDAKGVTHTANDLGWDKVPVRTWVHVMFVWDTHGIGRSDDRLRIYRDGRLVATNTDTIGAIAKAEGPVRILANHAYNRLGRPALIGDELLVWAVPKHP
mgnify:CR=1 FL=1